MGDLATDRLREIERISELLEQTIRERENYNGYHQAAVMEIERLKAERDSLENRKNWWISTCKRNREAHDAMKARAEAAEKRLAEAEKVIRACQAIAIRHDWEATRMVTQFLNGQSHDR